MTKLRAPLSLDDALARIAGQVPGSWKAMADHVGYAARTVRKWGDEDADEEINLKAAIKLDILFQEHGGTGSPLYEAYGLLVQVAVNRAFADQFEVLRHTADIAKENGEAEEALLRYCLPGAGEAERRTAQKELLEARRKIDGVLPLLEAEPPEAHSRAPP